MSDRDKAGNDPFRIWLESSRRFLGADPASDSLIENCAALFAAWGRFAQAYAEAGAAAGAAAGRAGAPSGGPFDPVTWIDTAGAGGWGDLWNWYGAGEGARLWQAESDAFTASKQWLAYTTALERYRAAMVAGWLKAFERFAGELAMQRDPEGGLPPWEAVQALWQEAADAELAAAQRSEAFLSAQRDLIRARLDCSTMLAKRVDRLADLLGLPNRSELDALHEKVHGLNRQVRALRSHLDAVRRRGRGRGE